jgi:hypothetical protein
MPEPSVVRRPVPEKEPEDTSGRRGCITLGAVLGIAIGALVAFFVLPGVLHHYFGTAKMGLGETYHGDGLNLRAESIARRDPESSAGGISWFVSIAANPTRDRQLLYDGFELELDDGKRIRAVAASDKSTAIELHAAQPTSFLLRFDAAPGSLARPKLLHLHDPSVEFALALLGDGGSATPTYFAGDKLIRVDKVEMQAPPAGGQGAAWVVQVQVRSKIAWDPKLESFALVLSDGMPVPPLPAQEKVPVSFPHFEPGAERPFALSFQLPQTVATPAKLVLTDPPATIDLSGLTGNGR